MKRIYDREARNALARFFANCAKAVLKKTIADPDGMGEVAHLLRAFVGWIEERSGGDKSDALETFEFSELHRDFPQELAELLWRKTGVSYVRPTETEETELTDEEREADALIGRVMRERDLNEPAYYETESQTEPKSDNEPALYDLWITNGALKLSTPNLTLDAAEGVVNQLTPELLKTGPRIIPVGLRDFILRLEQWPSTDRTPETLGALAGELLNLAYGDTSGDQANSKFETFNEAMHGQSRFNHGRRLTPNEDKQWSEAAERWESELKSEVGGPAHSTNVG